MSKKITNEQKLEMIKLYKELGTYSAVAKKINISVATVTKYIKEQNAIKTYDIVNIEPKPIETIPLNSIITFSYLTKEEEESYENWLKEFGR